MFICVAIELAVRCVCTRLVVGAIVPKCGVYPITMRKESNRDYFVSVCFRWLECCWRNTIHFRMFCSMVRLFVPANG